jgi:putative membrane protein
MADAAAGWVDWVAAALAGAADHSVAAAPRGDGDVLMSLKDHARIALAVSAAEATTRGEIVCVVAEEASSYSEVPLAWAAAAALALPLLALAAGVHPDLVAWGWRAAHIAASENNFAGTLASYAAVQAILFLVILLLASIPVVRRFLTPASVKRGHVHQRAIEQFFASKLNNTRERTGVLIYASLKERCAEVIADAGINDKVPVDAWDDVINSLVSGIKAGDSAGGFVAAIERCGSVLAAYFPIQQAHPNQLPYAIVEAP